MEDEKPPSNGKRSLDDTEDVEPVELVLFQVPECYVYIIPPRKTAASYRADEWDVNKWAWEGSLKVISKGEECIIRLEDKATGELYARAFLRKGEQHPVESVIDSSRYFVLRIEENIGGRLRHAFIGLGFRERPQAYDFQAALHDHMKYLNKKEAAEEMEQQFQKSSSIVDYSLKDGETIVLQLKNNPGGTVKTKSIEQGGGNLSPSDKNKPKETLLSIKPPPPPLATISPSPPGASPRTPTPPNWRPENDVKKVQKSPKKEQVEPDSSFEENQSSPDVIDDDFGDFQAAG